MTKYLVLFLSVISFAVYFPSTSGSFVYDDFFTVVNNDHLTGGHTVSKILSSPSYWGSQHGTRFYRPIFTLVVSAIRSIGNNNPIYFHVFFLLLHTIVVILVFFISFYLTSELLLTFVVSFIYAIHPIHVENVAYITGGNDVLCAFFFFLLLFIQIKYPSQTKTYLLTILLLFLGFFSKETAIAYIPIYFAYLWMIGHRINNPAKTAVVFTVSVFAILAIRFSIQGSFYGIDTPDYWFNFIPYLSAWHAKLSAVKVLGLYIAHILFPISLSPDYSFPIIQPFGVDFLSILLFILPIALLALIFVIKDNIFRFGIIFFFITISLVSNFLFPIGTIMGDRLLYIPSFGLILAIVRLWQILSRKFAFPKFVSVAVFTIFSFFFIFQTITYSRVWNSSMDLWSYTIKHHPKSSQALANLSTEYAKADFNKALSLLNRALAVNDKNYATYNGIGRLYEAKLMLDSANSYYSKAISLNPFFLPAYLYRGINYGKQGNNLSAIEDFKKCLELNNNQLHAHFNLAFCLYRIKDFDNSLIQINAALQLNADPNLILLRAKTYLELKEPLSAVKDLQTCLSSGFNIEEARYYLSYANILLNNTSGAIEEMRLLLKTNPEYHEFVLKQPEFKAIYDSLR